MNPERTILIVDDDPRVLVSLRRDLEPLGHRVLLARSADEAASRLAEHKSIDLVVIDVIMPHVDGRELGRQIRQRYPKSKLLFISGSPHEGLARFLKRVDGASLRKPFTPQEFIDAIQALIE